MMLPSPPMRRIQGDRSALPGFDANREQYTRINDNPFVLVAAEPRTSFSTDVDRASYGNVRRFITEGGLPPKDAVRIEEMINYFPYDLPEPTGSSPIAILTELGAAPWAPRHHLLRIALKARRIETDRLPTANLVFLVDVSGSMDDPRKLPLVQRSLRLLVEQLRPQDRVSIVTYANGVSVPLAGTSGAQKDRILWAIDELSAGGGTAGEAGLELAYRQARRTFVPDGNNRVILATDGDFNLGPSSDAEMERLIERQRGTGIYLTVLGFGTGNYQDSKMKAMAKAGNGNYAYIDEIGEARKQLVEELGGTLVTVANDAKLQLEFNPAYVHSYRLIGYEGRLLRDQEFTDDGKDAGDIGSGHSVTALVEIVPVEAADSRAGAVEPRRYQDSTASNRPVRSGELAYLRLRYKVPGEGQSTLVERPIGRALASPSSTDFRFAAAIAAWGMLLRDSPFKGSSSETLVRDLARSGRGADVGGHRRQFNHLLDQSALLPGRSSPPSEDKPR